MSLLQDGRLRTVQWRDLTHLSPLEMIIENTITIPWLIISCLLAWKHYYILALPFSFIFFLTGLRQAHNGFHHKLGTSKFLTEVTLWTNSTLMLAAMHAIKYNHLRHHQYCLFPPPFIIRQHAVALRSNDRGKVVGELLVVAAFITIVFTKQIPFLQYHILAMLAGELCTGFFAVWTVHHDCDEEVFARTLSRRWKNRLTYNMFYHLEHHLFPGVPTIKLPVLAARIRKAIPDVTLKEVF